MKNVLALLLISACNFVVTNPIAPPAPPPVVVTPPTVDSFSGVTLPVRTLSDVAPALRACSIQVTPANYQAQISGSKSGSVVCFSSGNYSAVIGTVFPAGVFYQALNGATFSNSDIHLLGGSTLSGFILNAVTVHAESGVTIQYNTFNGKGSSDPILFSVVDDVNNVAWKQSAQIHNVQPTIEHDAIIYNRFIGTNGMAPWNCNQSAIDANVFEEIFEALHIGNGGNGAKPGYGNNCSVSNNYISGTSRHALEMQFIVNGFRVNGNYIEKFHLDNDGGFDSHMAISLAIAGSWNVEVGHNVLIHTEDTAALQSNNANKGALEIMMGHFHIHHNYIWNWGSGFFGFVDDNFAVNAPAPAVNLIENNTLVGTPFGFNLYPASWLVGATDFYNKANTQSTAAELASIYPASSNLIFSIGSGPGIPSAPPH